MWQTLFHIPREVGGIPLFGFGALLAVWAVLSVAWIAYLVRRRSGFDSEVRSYLPVLLLFGAAIAFVLPRLTGPEGIPIRGYGAMLVVAVIFATALVIRRAGQVGIDADTVISLVFWVFVWGIVGARLFYVVEYWEQFRGLTPQQTVLNLFNIAQGGLVIYGGLIGGGVALAILIRRHALPALPLLDATAAPLILAMAIGRIGCLLNGCCFGGVCDLPWAMQFPAGSPPHLAQLERGEVHLQGITLEGAWDEPALVTGVAPDSPAAEAGLKPGDRLLAINGAAVDSKGAAISRLLKDAQAGQEVEILTSRERAPLVFTARAETSLPIHPTQAYSTINGVILFLLLWSYFPYRRRDGEVAALLLTLYPITRFLLEMIRTDEPPQLGTGLTVSQLISLLILAGAAILWTYILSSPVARRRSAAAA